MRLNMPLGVASLMPEIKTLTQTFVDKFNGPSKYLSV